MGQLGDRRAQTSERLGKLRGSLKEAEKVAANKACIYATGSFGRGEASPFSDLDVFIVGKKRRDGKKGSALSHLDDICVSAELIHVARGMKFPDFSGDGRYLVHHSVADLIDTLGDPQDEAVNTFTARLLLLLENVPLVEANVYEQIKKEVVSAYWRDYEDHQGEFIPAYLANDILRLWRTFCVNYEARTEPTPEEKKAKRKLTNYKLKHSRLLTCYSALLYLLALYARQNSVSQTDALQMMALAPTERLEWLQRQTELAVVQDTLTALLAQYEIFLETTNASEQDLIARFMEKKTAAEYMSAAYKFGDLMFEALAKIGNGNKFYRLLVV